MFDNYIEVNFLQSIDIEKSTEYVELEFYYKS